MPQMNYATWRRQIDNIIGVDARERLGNSYSWLGAWQREELTPHEAIQDALARLEAKVDRFDPAEPEMALRAYLASAS